MDLPIIPGKTKEMVGRMEKNGFVEARETPAQLLPDQEYRLYPNRYIKTAHWSITGKCNYKCKQCYMSAPDANCRCYLGGGGTDAGTSGGNYRG